MWRSAPWCFLLESTGTFKIIFKRAKVEVIVTCLMIDNIKNTLTNLLGVAVDIKGSELQSFISQSEGSIPTQNFRIEGWRNRIYLN